MASSRRKLPNILVCGTPGTGKSSLVESVCASTDLLNELDVGLWIKERNLHEDEMDTDFDALVVDEDKLLDEMEAVMGSEDGGNIVHYHGADLFPERWFDLVVVLRVSTEVLYDRLTAREYSDKKRAENVEAEILQVILDEAQEGYDESVVQVVESNTLDDMESNCDSIVHFVNDWQQ